MKRSFAKKTSLSRFVSLTLVMLLMLTVLSGCSLIPSRQTETEQSTVPTVENTEPETTTAPTTEATVPPTTAPKKDNIAVVKEQLNVRSSPSTGSRVITTLDAGEEVEVIRVEPIGTVQWAYVSSESLNVMGWIVTDMLDMSNVTISSGSTVTPANTDPTTGSTPTQATVPVDNITGTGAGSTPANSQVGIVNTNTLNIRASASTSAERVGSYTYGDRITILETSNGWGRTDKGWVSMNYVTLQQNNAGGNTGAGTGTGTGNATVTGNAVNIRSGAGTNYPTVGSVSKGTSLNILETTTVAGTQWGRTDKGWICMDYVSMTGSVGSTGVGTGTGNGAVGTGNATVTGSGLNIRSGAGTGYAVVGTLPQGAAVNIQETVSVNGTQWGRINQGWICLDYVKMN